MTFRIIDDSIPQEEALRQHREIVQEVGRLIGSDKDYHPKAILTALAELTCLALCGMQIPTEMRKQLMDLQTKTMTEMLPSVEEEVDDFIKSQTGGTH